MRSKKIKKWISGFLVLMLLSSVMKMPVYGSEAETVLKHNMENFVEEGYGELLIKREGFYHMDFVEELRNNPQLNVYMAALDLIYNDVNSKLGEPSEEKYRDALINIMKIYEMDNATNIAEQHKLDNNKSAGSYVFDVVKLGASLVGMSKAAEKLDAEIKFVINQVLAVIDNTSQYIETASNLQTLIENYSNHSMFLILIEENSEGNLKDAAAYLRENMHNMMKIVLDSYRDTNNKSMNNVIQTGVLDNVTWDILKNSDLYKQNVNFKRFTNFGQKLTSTISDHLVGLDLGKLAGNLAVQGEDGLNCFLELKAIYDISFILEKTLKDYEKNYNDYFETSVETTVKNYVAYGNYLISCRVRGEYRFYSMFADRGITNIFYGKSEEVAIEVFDEMVNKFTYLKENLDALANISMVEISDYFYKRDELVGLLVMGPLPEEKHNISYDSQGFIIDDFILEWENDIFSISNSGCGYVKLFDIMLGDALKESEEKLFNRGWFRLNQYENSYEYLASDSEYYMCIKVDENDKVIYWYINNWPEGEYYTILLEELKNGSITPNNEHATTKKDWNLFVESRDFENLIDVSNTTSLEYVIYDINSDGDSELLLESADESPFYTTWVFVYRGDKIELVFEKYGYGQFRYSPKQNAVLVSPETKPSSMAGISPFYQLKGCDFEYVYAVGQDLGQSFYSDSQGEKEITNEERMSYFDDVVHFEWNALQ